MSAATLRFARELYAGEAVDQALKRLADYASFDRSEEADYWVVRVTPHKPKLLRRLCGELHNHALGLTIQRAERR